MAAVNIAAYFIAEFGLNFLQSIGCFSRNKGHRRKEHKMYLYMFLCLKKFVLFAIITMIFYDLVQDSGKSLRVVGK